MYQYDGAGRLCAVRKNVTGLMVGYLYDANGRRVAKGTINPPQGTDWCNVATNGFTLTTRDVVGLDEQTLRAFDSAGASHSNIPLAGGVEASLTADPNTQAVTHFQFTDWLGTRRLQTDALGSPEEICSGGAFGDALSCTGQAATNRHFTGQERDAETEVHPGQNDGLDYFGARHYSSALGRFMSPDPSGLVFASPSNPQSLNLYSYAWNNPLINTDPTGMECVWDDGSYDSADDPYTGNAWGCSNQGGTYVNPDLIENALLTNGQNANIQYGSWSEQANSTIASSWATPSGTAYGSRQPDFEDVATCWEAWPE